MEIWEKRACNLVAINSHTDLFSLAAYLCLQQESMSVNALSRLLEVVAKSVKPATAVLTILAIELFRARRDTAIASSKLLLDHSSHELRNAPINYLQLLSPAFSKKSGGTLFLVFRGAWRVARGAWFRVFSRYFVPLTPPTVFVRSF